MDNGEACLQQYSIRWDASLQMDQYREVFLQQCSIRWGASLQMNKYREVLLQQYSIRRYASLQIIKNVEACCSSTVLDELDASLRTKNWGGIFAAVQY